MDRGKQKRAVGDSSSHSEDNKKKPGQGGNFYPQVEDRKYGRWAKVVHVVSSWIMLGSLCHGQK